MFWAVKIAIFMDRSGNDSLMDKNAAPEPLWQKVWSYMKWAPIFFSCSICTHIFVQTILLIFSNCSQHMLTLFVGERLPYRCYNPSSLRHVMTPRSWSLALYNTGNGMENQHMTELCAIGCFLSYCIMCFYRSKNCLKWQLLDWNFAYLLV